MEAEILKDVKTYLGEGEDSLLLFLVQRASRNVINKRHPYGAKEEAAKLKAIELYRDIVFDAVIYAYSKQGGEFQTQMSENGISRSWIDETSLYTDIVPFVGVM